MTHRSVSTDRWPPALRYTLFAPTYAVNSPALDSVRRSKWVEELTDTSHTSLASPRKGATFTAPAWRAAAVATATAATAATVSAEDGIGSGDGGGTALAAATGGTAAAAAAAGRGLRVRCECAVFQQMPSASQRRRFADPLNPCTTELPGSSAAANLPYNPVCTVRFEVRESPLNQSRLV